MTIRYRSFLHKRVVLQQQKFSDQVEQNLAIDAAASNAVDNNYLTQRDVTAARALIAANCTNSCGRSMNGLDKTSARFIVPDLRGRCSIGPEACSCHIEEISDGLTELQSIESQLAFASNPLFCSAWFSDKLMTLTKRHKGLTSRCSRSSLEGRYVLWRQWLPCARGRHCWDGCWRQHVQPTSGRTTFGQ